MASRFKRIKRKRKVVKKETAGGSLFGEPCGPTGWLRLLDFEENKRYRGGSLGFQQSSCGATGDIYVRPLDGRFQGMPEEELRTMVEDLRQVFVRAGYPPVVHPDMPLWEQAEFLDNMIEFELNPPCGCESELGESIARA